jgi:ATPase family AAA domain-containing protein 3A/B
MCCSLCTQASAYASDDGVLTEKIIDARVADMLLAHQRKVRWQQDDTKKAAEDSYKSLKNLSVLTPSPSSN